MDRELIGGQPVTRKCRNCLSRYSRGRPSPPGVDESNDPRGVRDEHRHTISDSNCERDTLLGGDVAVGLVRRSEPAFPTARVHKHPGSMDLPDRCKPAGALREFLLNGGPATHHFVHGLGAGKTECPGVPRRSERANSPTFEVGDYFFRNSTHR